MRPPRIRALSFHLIPASFTPTVPNSYRALVRRATLPTSMCLNIKFLFVKSVICLRLPSDSASLRTPLPLAVRLPLLSCVRDLHPLDYAHVGRTRGIPANFRVGRDSFFIFKKIIFLLAVFGYQFICVRITQFFRFLKVAASFICLLQLYLAKSQ